MPQSDGSGDGIRRIDIAEFRALGYIQEVNRLFLHPRGLALEVAVEEDGSERLGGVWDYRDDPEGMAFGEGMIDAEKAARVAEDLARLEPTRLAALGYIVQPVEEA